MKSNLDAWMSQLAEVPPDHNLAGLEARVCRDIALLRQQERAVRAMAPARVIALSVAVVIGAVAGGTMAISALRAPALGAFTAGSELAPSTLLAGV